MPDGCDTGPNAGGGGKGPPNSGNNLKQLKQVELEDHETDCMVNPEARFGELRANFTR